MFYAFIIICAATLNLEVDRSSCILLEDAWGPYVTEENCNIRVDQMLGEISNSDAMNAVITMSLGNPPMLFTDGGCTTPPGESI